MQQAETAGAARSRQRQHRSMMVQAYASGSATLLEPLNTMPIDSRYPTLAVSLFCCQKTLTNWPNRSALIKWSGDQPFGSLNRLRADQNRSTDRQIGRRSAQLKCYRCLLLMLTSRAVRRRLPVWRVDVARCIPFSFDGTMLTSCCWSGRRMFLEVL